MLHAGFPPKATPACGGEGTITSVFSFRDAIDCPACLDVLRMVESQRWPDASPPGGDDLDRYLEKRGEDRWCFLQWWRAVGVPLRPTPIPVWPSAGWRF